MVSTLPLHWTAWMPLLRAKQPATLLLHVPRSLQHTKLLRMYFSAVPWQERPQPEPIANAGCRNASSSSSCCEQGESDVRIKAMLLCGADMVESLALPGVWRPEHVRSILGDHGIVCISR